MFEIKGRAGATPRLERNGCARKGVAGETARKQGWFRVAGKVLRTLEKFEASRGPLVCPLPIPMHKCPLEVHDEVRRES